MPTHILRAVVRGQFDRPTPQQRAALTARLDDHDIFRAAYTASGTLTYDAALVAFSYRYEIRLVGEPSEGQDPIAVAESRALALARADLEDRGIAAKRLRVTVTDMAGMWRPPGAARQAPTSKGKPSSGAVTNATNGTPSASA